MENSNGVQLTGHWKRLLNPDYIGAYALEPDQDLLLTIKSIVMEKVTGPDGKKEDCAVAYFKEADVKPMILNATNMKMIGKLHKSHLVETWVGKKIQLYATPVQAFGQTVDALRIRDFLPQAVELDVTDAIALIESSGTLEELRKNFLSLGKEYQSNKKVNAKTEELKKTLK